MQKDYNYGHLVGWVFSMFESKMGWHCCIFEHGHSNKRLGTSDYCCREAIIHVLESLLCKVLLSFNNSRLTDSALMFLVSCKLGPERHPLFCHLASRYLITRYFCLLFSDKSAHFLTKNHRVDYFWRLGYC